MAKLWATLMPFISNKCTFACVVFINECSACLEYGLLESNNFNWMKNERAKNYVAEARQYLSLWSELYEKSPQSAIFNIYLFWVKIKELLIEFTVCKTLGCVSVGYHYLCVVSCKSICFCGLESLPIK